MPQSNDQATRSQQQNISLTGRAYLTVTGAEDVISFDENSIALQTTMGILSIEGSELHIKHLSTESSDGSVQIEGRINGMLYIDDNPASSRRGLFGRRR